jgi:molecular chaperone HtpG
VLLLADPVDAFWVSTAVGYEGKPFKSVTQGAADIKAIPLAEGAKPQPGETPAAVATLFAFFKQTLGDQIEDVRASDRLTDSVACLVAPEFGPDRQLEKMLASHGRMGERTKPILEVNAGHPLIASLARRLAVEADKSLVEDSAWLVFDEARLLEGEAPNDATAFAARLRRVMEKALG